MNQVPPSSFLNPHKLGLPCNGSPGTRERPVVGDVLQASLCSEESRSGSADPDHPPWDVDHPFFSNLCKEGGDEKETKNRTYVVIGIAILFKFPFSLLLPLCHTTLFLVSLYVALSPIHI